MTAQNTSVKIEEFLKSNIYGYLRAQASMPSLLIHDDQSNVQKIRRIDFISNGPPQILNDAAKQ
jgi:hypothetical protein